MSNILPQLAIPFWEGGCSLQQLFNITGFLIFIIVSSFGGSGALGESIGQVSDSYPTAITPASYTFSIWSVIFVLTGALSIYQVAPSRREWAWKELGLWWSLNTWIGEGLWTFAWCGRWGGMWIAALLLVFIVVTLIILYLRIDPGIELTRWWPWSTPKLTLSQPKVRSWTESVFLEGGIGLYLGWTTVATILGITIALTASGVPPQGPATIPLSILVLLAASVIALCGAVFRLDFWFSGAIAWALWGIRSKQMSNLNPMHEPVVRDTATATACFTTICALCALCFRFVLWHRTCRDPASEGLLGSLPNKSISEGKEKNEE